MMYHGSVNPTSAVLPAKGAPDVILILADGNCLTFPFTFTLEREAVQPVVLNFYADGKK